MVHAKLATPVPYPATPFLLSVSGKPLTGFAKDINGYEVRFIACLFALRPQPTCL